MKIAVLGSEGQVGKYLSEYLKGLGHEVFEFDKVNNEMEDMTIIPNAMLDEIIKKSDFVFFLAFDVGGSRYLKKYQNTFEFINNNSRLMINTFEILKKYKKDFIFASSQMSNMSYSPYGLLKGLGELYTKSLNGLVVKFWNVYGIEKDSEKFHVITDFIVKAKNKNLIDMITDGEEEREFLYALDCCEALNVVMENYKKIDRNADLCITSFKSNKIIDIAKIILEYFPDASIKLGVEKDSVQMNKKNKPDEYILNFWQPKTSIESGIEKVIKGMGILNDS